MIELRVDDLVIIYARENSTFDAALCICATTVPCEVKYCTMKEWKQGSTQALEHSSKKTDIYFFHQGGGGGKRGGGEEQVNQTQNHMKKSPPPQLVKDSLRL